MSAEVRSGQVYLGQFSLRRQVKSTQVNSDNRSSQSIGQLNSNRSSRVTLGQAGQVNSVNIRTSLVKSNGVRLSQVKKGQEFRSALFWLNKVRSTKVRSDQVKSG